MIKKSLFFVLIFPFLLQAQQSDLGNWLIYFGDKKINPKFNWHNEVQYRNHNLIGDIEQLFLRTGLGYNLSDNNNNVLLGYGFIYSEPYLQDGNTKTSIIEHRIFQQFITKQRVGRLSFHHRFRFEQRIINQDFRLRKRYFLSLNFSLNNKQMQDKTLYLSTYNELFIILDQNFFERNRLYGGIGYRISKYIKSEIGLMNQHTAHLSKTQLNFTTFVSF
jgi:hypothetical protein